jgi:hypothetical protein
MLVGFNPAQNSQIGFQSKSGKKMAALAMVTSLAGSASGCASHVATARAAASAEAVIPRGPVMGTVTGYFPDKRATFKEVVRDAHEICNSVLTAKICTGVKPSQKELCSYVATPIIKNSKLISGAYDITCLRPVE